MPAMRAKKLLLALAALASAALPTFSAPLNLPKEARDGLGTLYRGDPDAAITVFRRMETAQPDSPLGYLLEAEARWWKIYCTSLDLKWNLMDAWLPQPGPDDAEYMRIADKAISLAEAQLQQNETAEMHLYAGIGYALRVRLFGLRKENRAAAHAGVAARQQLLRATEMDLDLADADTGIGLYNYYVDTLSGIARILRVFMGLPAGNKDEGIRQLERAMERGELTGVDARFYLSKNLRTYDQKYQRALEVLEPLTTQYPHNPVFALMLGNLYAMLGRNDRADALYRSAAEMPVPDAQCKAHIAVVVQKALDALTNPQK
jgi:hypothetical protein